VGVRSCHAPCAAPARQVEALFEAWLRRASPDRADAVWNRILDVRGGRPDEARFGHRMRGQGPWAAVLDGLFRTARGTG
jgi:hypothetical protein